MDTISLYYFTEAAKDLNFTQTANRLFLSQQNLSSHIARLESKCGCKLFQRKPKVQLTYEGELFLAYAKEAVASESNILLCAEGRWRTRIPGGCTSESLRPGPPFSSQRFCGTLPKPIPASASGSPTGPLTCRSGSWRTTLWISAWGCFSPRIRSCRRPHLLTDGLYLCMSDGLLRTYAPDRAEDLLHTGQDGITMAEFPGLPVALPSDGIPLSRVILSCYEETGVAPNVLLNTAYPQIFRALYFQGTAAFFATGMILSDHLRNRPAGVPPLHAFPLLLNWDFIKREITLLTNRHRYLSKPAQHFISLTQAFFAAIELERIWLPDTKLNISGLN